MTNAEIEGTLAQLSDVLSEITKAVVSLVKQQSVLPEFRAQHVNEADALQTRVDAIRHSVSLKIETKPLRSDYSQKIL